MCGIVGYIGKAQAVPVLVSGLEKLEYRGYDSAGISIFENGKIETIKTKGRLADLEKKNCRRRRKTLPYRHWAHPLGNAWRSQPYQQPPP